MKSTYWSCSKFADWIRGIPNLKSGTAEEWYAWKKLAKQKAFRYWLAETALDSLQDIIFWPANRFRALLAYINNRWITKSHALTSNLKKGQWYDFDMRLLHTVFDELVNFVEIEQAWMETTCSKGNRKKYSIPLYRRWSRIRLWRSPEAGIAYLQWASNLKMDEEWMDKEAPDFGKSTHQALAAQETFLLYKWWKEDRPKRKDPHDTSGWTQYCENKRKINGDQLCDFFRSGNDNEAHHILDLCRKIETEQAEEDTAMLIRLIKLRHSLWT